MSGRLSPYKVERVLSTDILPVFSLTMSGLLRLKTIILTTNAFHVHDIATEQNVQRSTVCGLQHILPHIRIEK